MADAYRKEVLRTAGHRPLTEALSMGALGLAGEAGEVVDLVKKFVHHDKPFDREKLILELGDVHWYLEYIAAVIGVDTDVIKAANVAKLRMRYPNGYTHEAAKNRVDTKGNNHESEA